MSAPLLPDEAYRRLMRERLHTAPEPPARKTPQERAEELLRSIIAGLDEALQQEAELDRQVKRLGLGA